MHKKNVFYKFIFSFIFFFLIFTFFFFPENPLRKELAQMKDNLFEINKYCKERLSENVSNIPKNKKIIKQKTHNLLMRIQTSEEGVSSKVAFRSSKEFKKKQKTVATLVTMLIEPTNTPDLLQKYSMDLHKELVTSSTVQNNRHSIGFLKQNVFFFFFFFYLIFLIFLQFFYLFYFLIVHKNFVLNLKIIFVILNFFFF